MRIRCAIVVERLRDRCRALARHLGAYCKVLGRRLVMFGEEDTGSSWGTASFSRLEFAELEITGAFPKAYCGPVYAAFFQCPRSGGKRYVVVRLNWIAEKDSVFGVSFPGTPWSFGGSWDVIVDPVLSPLRWLPDGSLWFVWPNGSYGVFRFDPREHLPFMGDAETPRIYTYY